MMPPSPSDLPLSPGVVSLWDLPGRPTRALIDLDAIAANAAHLRRLVGPQTALMAVVKANGYGHGAEMVARAAVAAGAEQLAVATVDEGAALRAAGLSAPILVLGPIHTGEIEKALRYDLSLTLCSVAFAGLVERTAHHLHLATQVSCHVKVDTGMHRFGADVEQAVAVAARASASPYLRLDGVFTHFADADAPDESFTIEQATCLDAVLRSLEEQGIRPGIVHAANSAAILRSRRFDYGMVRAGIALYGLSPADSLSLPTPMRPALSIRSTVGRVIELSPGDSVGYGRTYRAAKRERAALVPIGYADGYRRDLSSRAWMGIRGASAPVAGRVSMDQTVVGAPEGLPVRIGDEVVVVGSSGEGAPTATELAKLLDTIPYEIVAAVAARVPRYYIWRGELLSSPVLGIGPPAALTASPAAGAS